MNRYLFEKGQTFSIRKLTVGWRLLSWDWHFFASGTVRADETSPATTSNLDQQMKQVADIEETKTEPVKEEGRVEAENKKHLLPIPTVLTCSLKTFRTVPIPTHLSKNSIRLLSLTRKLVQK